MAWDDRFRKVSAARTRFGGFIMGKDEGFPHAGWVRHYPTCRSSGSTVAQTLSTHPQGALFSVS